MTNRFLLGAGLVCLALLWAAEPARAQRGGGGGGGGGHAGGGGGHAGGGHPYGGHPYGYGGSRPYYGGYGRGYGYGSGYYGGYGRGYGYPYAGGYALGLGLGYGLGSYPLGFPDYGSYYNAPSYGYSPGYAGAAVVPDYGYAAPPAFADPAGPAYAANPEASTYQSYYSGQPRNDAGTAGIRVVVPTADAQVLFDGAATRQRGTDRTFVTPSLPAGRESRYTITASWLENGRQVSRVQTIAVTPGSQVVVNFQGAPR